MAICEVLVAVTVILFAFVLRYLLQRRGQLEALGIPIIKPFFIFGSPPFKLYGRLFHEESVKNHKKFGKTYGRYDGREATIYTIDPELIKAVMVKHFENFADIVDWELPDNQRTIDVTTGEEWKSLRKSLSPTFTSGKLKAMLQPMEAVIDNLFSHLEKEIKKNPVIEMKSTFQQFALDVISICAFGIQTNSFQDPNNEILVWGRQVFSVFTINNWIENAFTFFFAHFTFLNRYMNLYSNAAINLYQLTKQLMAERRVKNIVKDDFISRLNDILNAGDPKLTEDLVAAQGIIFYVAGFETTANTMSTLCYNLAKYPEIQERIHEEIQEKLEESENGKIDYEVMTKLNYLEAVINENLRLNGPGTDNFRICGKDTEVNGMKFKKGMRIWMPVYAAHHNEEFFPEPEKFKPERFLKENASEIIPFTFRPFGGGNRMCIGLRFAMNEMKLCMSHLLHKYRIELAPESKLEFKAGSIFLLNFDEVKVRLVPRN